MLRSVLQRAWLLSPAPPPVLRCSLQTEDLPPRSSTCCRTPHPASPLRYDLARLLVFIFPTVPTQYMYTLVEYIRFLASALYSARSEAAWNSCIPRASCPAISYERVARRATPGVIPGNRRCNARPFYYYYLFWLWAKDSQKANLITILV